MTISFNMPKSIKPPIVNCHTHIFKGEHVPPYLAKTFVIWPFSKILNTPFILSIFKRFINHQTKDFKDPDIKKRRDQVKRNIRLQRNVPLSIFISALKLIVTFHALFIIFSWLNIDSKYTFLKRVKIWLIDYNLLFDTKNLLLQIIIVAILVLFVKSGRNFIWFIVRRLSKVLSLIPGKMTRDLIERYMLLGRFTIYKDQSTTFSKLVKQYPPGSKFIVLPMDMEYMGAGQLKKGFKYHDQMAELAKIKEQSSNKAAILPFVFLDPRRITEDQSQFQYTFDPSTGKVTLENCFIKDYIENKGFNGFKIYPALGYYPFDEALLPIWKYAADNQIPIMTHCIKGTIFYRGSKKKEWDKHPVFKEYISLKPRKLGPLLLPERKNLDFSLNFTHPMNYLILLKEELLRIWIGQTSQSIKDLFGYTNDETPLKWDLSHLKICFAHFGGEDQWKKYLEADRYDYAQQIIQKPTEGIDFLYTSENKFSWKKLEDGWKYVDWYSIICSMILQHDNVYADISYILHNDDVFPLLRETINNPHIGNRILFGTDFFVVRNHSTEKELVSEVFNHLTDEEVDLIARQNPISYLLNRN